MKFSHRRHITVFCLLMIFSISTQKNFHLAIPIGNIFSHTKLLPIRLDKVNIVQLNQNNIKHFIFNIFMPTIQTKKHILEGHKNIINFHETTNFVESLYVPSLSQKKPLRAVVSNQQNQYFRKFRLENLVGTKYLGKLSHLDRHREVFDFHKRYRIINQVIIDFQGENASFRGLGLTYDSVEKYNIAIRLYQRQLDIARQIGDQQGEVIALKSIGIAYYSLCNYDKAIEFYQLSLKLQREIGDRQGEGNSLENLGIAYDALGHYQRAISFHQQALSIQREIGDKQGEGNSLGNLGVAHNYLGNYQQAINFHRQALAIQREIGYLQGEVHSLGNLGVTYDSLSNYQKAIDFHQQALTIAKKISYRQGEAKSLGNLGNAYDSMGDYPKAIDFHVQRLTIAKAIGHRLGESQSLGNLGNAYYSLGDYSKAIDFHQQSLVIKREIGHRLGESQSLGNLGNAYYSLDDYRKAIDFYKYSLAIKREIGHRIGEANSLGNLGNAYYSLGDYPKAIDFHQQTLAIASEIGYRLGEAQSLGSLGNVYYSLDEYQEAIQYYKRYLILAREIGYRLGEAQSLNNLGAVYLNTQQYSQAESNLHDAIGVWEALRYNLSPSDQISIFETQAVTYRTLQTVHMAQKETKQALEIAERGRTRALIRLQAKHLPVDNTAELFAPPNITLLQQIAKAQNATLVEYSLIHDQSLLIWVIQPNGQITTRPVVLKELGETVSTLEEQTRQWLKLTRGQKGKDNEIFRLIRNSQLLKFKPSSVSSQPTKNPLRTLHQYLIEPISDLLPTDPNKRVIFIPHRSLFQVPFAALIDQEGKYLIHHHTIVTAQSIQALAFTRLHSARVQGKVDDILIVGNPTLSPELAKQFPPLPGTIHEANAISQLLNAPAPLIGAEATETAVKTRLHQAKLIHLATHSKLSNSLSFNPGMIALGPSNKDDGRLETQELLQMTKDKPLNAELVVLSACETGRGRITADGVVGLSRAWMAAGVPSLVVSLWNVEDGPTAELMETFYRNWHQKGMDKAQALRQAMLTILQKHPDPQHWAAFTLIGEAD